MIEPNLPEAPSDATERRKPFVGPESCADSRA